MKLNGKVAVVTGASKGIGAEIAKAMAAEGASVVVNYSSSKADADKVVAEIKGQGGKAIAVRANMAKQSEIQQLFAETIKAFGKVDILVNNAGVYGFIPLEEVTAEEFHRMFDINVLGLLIACQEAAKYFGPAGGSIINISSVASSARYPNNAVYGATKAAVDQITRSLSAELGHRKIRVNSINPGLVETPGTTEIVKSDFRKKAEEGSALGRIGQPHDIAPAVVFFASDDASWITGESLFISGGRR